MSGPADLLIQRLAGMDIALGRPLAAQLVALLDRMGAEQQNLSAIDDVLEGVDRHLADSLSGLAVPEVARAAAIADIGSGAGFPGLALAMFRPECAVTLVESERRKTEWLTREAASLPNVRVVGERTETLARREREGWPVVTARAVAPFPAVVELAGPLVSVGGCLVVWRGDDARDDVRAEAAASLLGFGDHRAIAVSPFPDARRALHVFTKTAPTDPRYPRRAGRATARPIA
jgi:16S rRNA (guanine527-N7)-methyltransferase